MPIHNRFPVEPEKLMVKEDIQELLLEFDQDAFEKFSSIKTDGKYHAIIIGGAALILLGYLSRKTMDVDVIEASHSIEKHIRESGVEAINTASAVFLYNLPEDYLDRVVPIDLGETIMIDYYSVSLEDVVVSKLASNRDKDIEDIRNSAVLNSIDWELLDRLVCETMESALNKEHASILKAMYRDYKKDAEKYFQQKKRWREIER